MKQGDLVVFKNTKTHWECMEDKFDQAVGGLGIVDDIDGTRVGVLCYHLEDGSWSEWQFEKKELEVIDSNCGYDIDDAQEFNGRHGDDPQEELCELFQIAFDKGDWGCQENSVRRVLVAIQEAMDLQL